MYMYYSKMALPRVFKKLLYNHFGLRKDPAAYRKQREDGQAVAGIALAAVKVRQIRPPNPCPVPLVLFRSF